MKKNTMPGSGGPTMRRARKALAAFLAVLVLAATAIPVGGALRAQPADDDPNAALTITIKVAARRTADSIVLRWAPEKALVWRKATAGGYAIERATLDRSGRPGAYKPLGGAVLPWNDEQWTAAQEALLASGRSESIEAGSLRIGQALVEEGGTSDGGAISTDDLGNLADRKRTFEMEYAMALLAAERSAGAAQGLGLRFVDREITRGEAYAYRIRVLGHTEPYTVTPGEINVSTTVHASGVVGSKIVTTIGQEGAIAVQWPSLTDYSGFSVERSSDNGATYVRLNPVPIVTLRSARSANEVEVYIDTGLVNGRSYRYRVFGSTAFADEDLIGEAGGMPRDRTSPGMPTSVTAEHLPPRAVRITWTMAEPLPADLAGFHIGRDTADVAAFPRLTKRPLPPSAREFIDTVRAATGPLYYRVEAIDSGGNVGRSFSAYVTFIDSTPPESPRWVRGTMDTNGVVRLLFHPNPEADVMGYRVLRANASDHEFSVVAESFSDDSTSRARDTLLVDTVAVETLTKYVYYRLVALDYHYNESESSVTLAVPRPDVVPPVPPVITGVRSTDTSVALEFAPSSSLDLRRHILYRRPSGTERWDSVAHIGREDSLFDDRIAEAHARFDYMMRAVDSAGLHSEPSNIVSAETYDNAQRPAVTELAIVRDSTRGEMRLSWKYGGLKERFRFVIYRALDHDELAMLAVVKDDAVRTFVDRPPSSSRVSYAVKVLADDGAESMLSVPAVVVLK